VELVSTLTTLLASAVILTHSPLAKLSELPMAS
jgi:hypothetical protein